jgi:hypothetical protein
MSCGTSFAAPHVSGTAALMLQANPGLAPDQVKAILQSTATPMLAYSTYEVGAGSLNTYAAVRKAAFSARYGAFRQQLNNSGFTISRDPIASFAGQIAPGHSVTGSFQVPADTAFASVVVSWINPGGLPGPLSINLGSGIQSFLSTPATALTGGIQKTGSTVTDPSAGTWTVTISNFADPSTGSTQQFMAAIETFHAGYSGLSDISELSPASQQAIKRAVRTGLMTTLSGGFAPGSSATRLDLARVLALGGGASVPQYLPYTPDFVDLEDDASFGLVESITNSPNGNLMGAVGPHFNPQSSTDRVTTAVAVVKALGLDRLAQTTATNPGISDWNLIPASARGYVAVAVSRNLMSAGATSAFRPLDPITRAELAATAVALQQTTR